MATKHWQMSVVSSCRRGYRPRVGETEVPGETQEATQRVVHATISSKVGKTISIGWSSVTSSSSWLSFVTWGLIARYRYGHRTIMGAMKVSILDSTRETLSVKRTQPKQAWITPNTLALIEEKRSCSRDSDQYRRLKRRYVARYVETSGTTWRQCVMRWRSIKRQNDSKGMFATVNRLTKQACLTVKLVKDRAYFDRIPRDYIRTQKTTERNRNPRTHPLLRGSRKGYQIDEAWEGGWSIQASS